MLFISLLGMMLTITANNVFGQQKCCFWLENLSPATAKEVYSLTPPVVGNTDYYAIRYNNTCSLPDASKISLDWEIWDLTNGTPVLLDGQLSQYAVVTIETWIEGEKSWVGTPLGSGSGLSSKLANPRDFPGGIDNPYVFTYMNTLPKFNYNYLYLHFLQYASDNTLMRLKIEWKQWGEYKVIMKLMERKNGTDYQLYYDDNLTQHQYYGGHAAILGNLIATDTLTVLHRSNDEIGPICSGDTVEYGRPLQKFVFSVIAPEPMLDTTFDVDFYNLDNSCIYKLDSVVTLRVLVNPEAAPPIVPEVNICGDGEATIIATHSLDTTHPLDYTIDYRWYEYIDGQKGELVQDGGNELTTPYLVEGESVSYYVTAVITETGCESNEGTVVTATSRYVPQGHIVTNTNNCPTEANVYVYAVITNVKDLVPIYPEKRPETTKELLAQLKEIAELLKNKEEVPPPFDFIWDGATGFEWFKNFAKVRTIAKCDSTYEFSVTIWDKYCPATFDTSFTTQDFGTPPSFTLVDTFFYLTDMQEACDFDATTEPTGIWDNCSKPNEIAREFVDDTTYVHNDGVYCDIVRTWTLTDVCGNDSTQMQRIRIWDTIPPTITENSEKYVAELVEGCFYRIAEGTFDSIRVHFEPIDNCTPAEEIEIKIYDEEGELFEGDTVLLGQYYYVYFIDKEGNTVIDSIEFITDIERVVTITAEPEIPCWDASVTLAVSVEPTTLTYTYEWDAVPAVTFENDDNTSDTVTAIPVEPVTESITYTYYVTVTDNYGCVVLDSLEVTTLPAPVFEITVLKEVEGCRDITIDLGSIEVTENANFDYFYIYEGDTLPFPTGTYKIEDLYTGDYTIVARDIETGCEYSIDTTIIGPTHEPVPHLSLNGTEDDIYLCYSGDTLYVKAIIWDGNSWDEDQYDFSTITPIGLLPMANDSLKVFAPGSYEITGVIINLTRGCTATVSHTIHVMQSPTFEIGHTPLCEGDKATLFVENLSTDPSVVDTFNYLWKTTIPLPVSINGMRNPTLQVPVTKIYQAYLTVTAVYDTLRCATTDTLYIIPIPKPAFEITTEPALYCNDTTKGIIDLVEFGGDYEYSYIYEYGAGTVSIENFPLSYLDTGKYIIAAFDPETQCYKYDTTEVLWKKIGFDELLLASFETPLTRADTTDIAFCFNGDTTINMRVDFAGDSRFSYKYTIITPDSISQQQSTVFKIKHAGDYIIQGYVENLTTGCISDIDTINVIAVPKPVFTLWSDDDPINNGQVYLCSGLGTWLWIQPTESYDVMWLNHTEIAPHGDSLWVNPSTTRTYTLRINNPKVDTVTCRVDTSIRVNVNEINPIEFSYDGTFCEAINDEANPFTISTLDIYDSYTWYKNGVLIEGETTNSLTIDSLTQAHIDTVYKLVVTYIACTDSAEFEFEFIGKATVEEGGPRQDSVCYGMPYLVRPFRINTLGLTQDSVYVFEARIPNETGCDSIVTLELYIRPLLHPEITSSATLPLCYNTSTDLDANAPTAVFYTWISKPSNSNRWRPAGFGSTLNPLTTGDLTVSTDYAVVVIDQYGCVGADTITINVLPELTIDLENNAPKICAGSNVDIDVSVDGFSGTTLVIEASTDEEITWNPFAEIPIINATIINIDSVIDVTTVFRAFVKHDENTICSSDTTYVTVEVYPDAAIEVTDNGSDNQEVCQAYPIETIYFTHNDYLWSSEAVALGLTVEADSIFGTPTVEPGTYTFWVFDIIVDCGKKDSLLYTLVINPSDTTYVTVTACDEYTWENGTTYYASVLDYYVLANEKGCDSVLVLDLTINPLPQLTSVTQLIPGTLCYGTTTTVEFVFVGTPPFEITYTKDAVPFKDTFYVAPYELELGAGYYEFTVVTDSLCSNDTITNTITIDEYINPNLTLNVEPKYCLGTIVECLATTAYAGDFASTIYEYGTETFLGDTNSQYSTAAFTHLYTNTATSQDVYFVVEFTGENGCIYTATSGKVNISDNPLLDVYIQTHNTSSRNDTIVNISQPVVFYFQVNNTCVIDPNTRVAVEYVYNHQDTAVHTLNNYLWSSSASPTLTYTTEMTNCVGASNPYNLVAENARYPNVGSGSISDPSAFVFGGNTMDYFRIQFISGREVKVTISGFSKPGIYVVDFDLVTYINSGISIPGAICGSTAVGGNNFGTGGATRVILASNTMTIEVLGSSPVPGAPGDDEDPLNIVNHSTAKSEMQVYPNPSTGENVTLKLMNMEGNTSIRMLSMDGKIITEQSHNIIDRNQTMVDLSVAGVAAGVYYIVVTNNEAVLTKKLVVQ